MKLKALSAQAQPYWVSIAIGEPEVEDTLDELWKAMPKSQRPKLPRPNIPKVRSSFEKHVLTALYQNFWLTCLTDTAEEHVENMRKVCYVTEMTAVKSGMVYTVSGLVYWEAQALIKEEVWIESQRYFVDTGVSESEVEQTIALTRAKHTFSEERAQAIIDGNPLAMGDTIRVKVKAGEPADKEFVITLDANATDGEWVEALEGSKVGQDIVLPVYQHRGTPDELAKELLVKVTSKLQADPPDDEEFCELEDVTDMAALREKVAMDVATFKEKNFEKALFTFLMANATIEPIPGPLIYDRSQAVIQDLDTRGRPDGLKKMSADDLENHCLSEARLQYTHELMSIATCMAFGIELEDHMIITECEKTGVTPSWAGKYVGRLTLAKKLAVSFFHKEAKATLAELQQVYAARQAHTQKLQEEAQRQAELANEIQPEVPSSGILLPGDREYRETKSKLIT